MRRLLIDCPKCERRLKVNKDNGTVNHFYCRECKQVYLADDIDWSKQMSTKATLSYARTKGFVIHIYYCFVKGYAIDLKIGNFTSTILINKEKADSLVKQLERKRYLGDKDEQK